MSRAAQLRRLFVIIWVIVGAVTLLIAAGAGDPLTGEGCQVRLAPVQLTAAGGTSAQQRVALPYSANGTIRLTGHVAAGTPDSHYGIRLVDATDGYIEVALSTAGEAGLWDSVGGNRREVRPWQPWPHVQIGSHPNEIQLWSHDGLLEVWINRERLWQRRSVAEFHAIELFGTGFAMPVTVRFEDIVIYHAC